MNRYIWPALFIMLAVTSCTVYNEYPIDVYKPGAVIIPPSVKNVTLVYRNFKYPGDTLQHYYKNDFKLFKASNDPENLDSLLVTSCLSELAKNLKSSGSFDSVRVIPYETFKRHSGEKLPLFNSGLVQKFTGNSPSELLISLETFSYFYSKYPERYETIATDEVITAAVWGVYFPAGEKMIERKTMIDTLVWNGYDDQGNYKKGYKAPPRIAALQIASKMAGENYAKRFYASWRTVNRIYSIPPLPDFSQAAAYFEEGKTDDAIQLWKKYVDDRNGKLAINARYNLALAYEIQDKIDLAVQWLTAARDLAVKTRSREDLTRIFSYLKALEQRQKEIQRLMQQ